MQLKFIAHASFMIRCSDCTILTDPWYQGRAFNESWALFPAPKLDPLDLEKVTHLWISHEHPDHLHLVTLKALDPDFKARVHVLFQRNNSDKVFDALRKMGFRTFTPMPHRQWISITPETRVYCAQIGQMDSCLAVSNAGRTVLDLNDCEANTNDCLRLRRDIGAIDVVLNQFSIAGYGGEADRDKFLPLATARVRAMLRENHRDLGAAATVPMASNIYFCMADNSYMNAFANTPQQCYEEFKARGQEIVMLYPGDTWEIGSPHDPASALERYRALYATLAQQPIDPPALVPLAEIEAAFRSRIGRFRERNPGWVLRRLQPVVCEIPDLNQTVRFAVGTGEFAVATGQPPDVSIYSQPLHFMFKWPWGLQTLGVSARVRLYRNAANWKRHRILFSLDNAEIFLKPSLLLTKRNLGWFVRRLPGAFNQLTYQLRRMRQPG